jgi:phosphoesterase RecJ-like protein
MTVDTSVSASADSSATPTVRPGPDVPAAVVERIARARNVLTVCHERPEADALGAALGVALIVEHGGGGATPVCSDPVPAMYDFLRGMERVRTDPDDGPYDLIVAVDCGELARVGPILERHADLFHSVPIVNIDHHVSNSGFGEIDWVDPTAAAACEQVTLLAQAMGVPLEAAEGALAAALMAGIVIDTATFQHPNTTPRTLRVAADLLAAGAPLAEISRRLYRSKPNAQLKLLGLVLAGIETDGDRLVHASLTEADLRRSGATPSQSEGIIDLLSQSETADVVLLFTEQGPRTRVSVRTSARVDATQLTGRFGGGGHPRAAGATIELPLAEARARVLAEAKAILAAT